MGARSTSEAFEILVEGSLLDDRNKNPVNSLTFTFPERVVGYVQFQVLSFWGRGGGLQFLEVLPGRKKKLGKKMHVQNDFVNYESLFIFHMKTFHKMLQCKFCNFESLCSDNINTVSH